MASIINAATSGGLITTADTSGILQLQTAGTTAVTVDASQNVTVVGSLTAAGLSGPHNGTVGATTPSTVVATTVKASTTMGVGGATPSASGSGITFPATQSASSDANTLDDYEEGTWTPVATPSSGSLTSYTSSGTYTKIGRSVVLQGIITITSLGTAGGTFTVTGLPFSLVTSPAQMPACAREGAVTGKLGQIYVNGATDMTIQDNTGATGAAVWTASYSWRFNITCFI